jgi:hypothetical protein
MKYGNTDGNRWKKINESDENQKIRNNT